MPEPILNTSATEADGVAEAVAHRLSRQEWVASPAGDSWSLRRSIPRGKADKIASRVVPIALDALEQTGGGMVMGGQPMDAMLVERVRRAVGMWKYLAWRVVIAIIARWLVEWWFSDRSKGYREARGMAPSSAAAHR